MYAQSFGLIRVSSSAARVEEENVFLAATATDDSDTEGTYLIHATKPRTCKQRPRITPNLGLETGSHVEIIKHIGFYPTSFFQLQTLGNVLGKRTHNRTLCDPACGTSRRIADLLRMLHPSRIFCFDKFPDGIGVRQSDLSSKRWCHDNLKSFYSIVTSLPYRDATKTELLSNLVGLLESKYADTHIVAIKMLSAYDSCRLDSRSSLMGQVAIEIKMKPNLYPGYQKPFPWLESWFIFLRNHVGNRTVVYAG
jgi:hypothetical protein